MKEHRKNLLKLIKIINTIKDKQVIMARDKGVDESKLDKYVFDGDLLSLRELTRMFIDEINGKYMQCEKDDVIVKFIEDMSSWLGKIYDGIVENKCIDSECIKIMKISNQLKKDYDKVYNEAKNSKTLRRGRTVFSTIINDYLEFGKNNFPKVEINKSEIIFNPEYTKKFDEIYEWVKKQKENEIFTVDKLEQMMNKIIEKQRK